MKPLLLLVCFIGLVSCANHRQQAIQTLCKGVNSTGRACSTAVGLPGKCLDCLREDEHMVQEMIQQPDISSLESKENSLIW